MLPALHDDGIDGRRHPANIVIFESSFAKNISIIVVGHVRRFLDTSVVVKHGTVGFLANG